jgi:hypothetical protein
MGEGGRKKEAVGFYPFVPDLTQFQKNDTIHIPANCFARRGDRVNFFSPFNAEGLIAMKQTEGTGEWYRYPGAQVATIKIGSDTFKKVFGEEWNPADTGQPVWFKDGLIKILTISIGVDKDDPNKRFSFIVGQKNAETTDPLALQFTAIPQPAAPKNGNH